MTKIVKFVKILKQEIEKVLASRILQGHSYFPKIPLIVTRILLLRFLQKNENNINF